MRQLSRWLCIYVIKAKYAPYFCFDQYCSVKKDNMNLNLFSINKMTKIVVQQNTAKMKTKMN